MIDFREADNYQSLLEQAKQTDRLATELGQRGGEKGIRVSMELAQFMGVFFDTEQGDQTCFNPQSPHLPTDSAADG